ncbi:hypothetical protein SAMN05421736_101266 [Evansella caseinilytica]|uniref:TraB family protein n=1 Tax=Evansella caseinilytica TaxID=1503961 RepID=A0A1H3GTY5_9BACI|nr:TraB/GumN family protein [Evansella caseinilytica]SDY06108.1 hypothetical protein SAMN05421736_101266 [Evansella caseinilytica]
MKNRISVIVISFIVFTGLIACSTATTTENTVAFEDKQLAEAVKDALSLEDGELTEEAVSELTELVAVDYGIQSLAGIDALEALKELHLDNNEIKDFSPLLELENLDIVNVKNNAVSFSEDADALSVIEKLESNGVTVIYGMPGPFTGSGGPPSHGVFYQVENGESTVYLFGSIHVGTEDLYPLHENIETAFAEADYLAVEIDMTSLNEMEAAQYMNQLGMFADGTTLRDLVSEEVFDRSLEIVGSYGFTEALLDMFKPWFIEQLISNIAIEELGYSSELGIDYYFMDRAEGNIDIIGLETFESQMDIFNMLSLETQAEHLEAALESYGETEEDMEEMMTLWKNGDVEALREHRLLDESESEEYQEYMRALMDDRDLEMTEKIEGFLQDDNGETYFVVVGALHLVGENSIFGLLQDRGYDVQPGIQ